MLFIYKYLVSTATEATKIIPCQLIIRGIMGYIIMWHITLASGNLVYRYWTASLNGVYCKKELLVLVFFL